MTVIESGIRTLVNGDVTPKLTGQIPNENSTSDFSVWAVKAIFIAFEVLKHDI